MMQTGYIVVAFGVVGSLKDLEIFKKKHQNTKKSLFKRFAFFKKKEEDSFGQSFTTKEFAEKLSKTLKNSETLFFDLNFPQSHKDFFEKIKNSKKVEKWIALPLSAIFNHNLSSSSAKIFSDFLEEDLLAKIFWIRSFATNRSFINYYQKKIKEFIINNDLKQKDSVLVFSAALENTNIDIYKQSSLELTKEILKGFPYILGKNIFSLENPSFLEDRDLKERKNVIFVSFNSLCTNYENFTIEKNFFPIIKKTALLPFSLSFTFDKDWQAALEDILQEELTPNKALILK